MDAIILFSHGSLLCGAGEALNRHAERIRATGKAPIVEVGYLNYSDPPFLDTVKKCFDLGVTHLVIVPYFLVPGYFVRVDLPKAIEQAKIAFPTLQFSVAEAIGFDERLADALIQSGEGAREQTDWRNELSNASNFCRPSNSCPLYGTPNCPKVPNLPRDSEDMVIE